MENYIPVSLKNNFRTTAGVPSARRNYTTYAKTSPLHQQAIEFPLWKINNTAASNCTRRLDRDTGNRGCICGDLLQWIIFFTRKATKSTSTGYPIVATRSQERNPPGDGPRPTALCDFLINDMPDKIIRS